MILLHYIRLLISLFFCFSISSLRVEMIFRTVFIVELFVMMPTDLSSVPASGAIIRLIDTHIEVRRRNYLMYATFGVCPAGELNQFLIIHIEYMDTTIPFIFVLMSRKTEVSYRHLFEYIEENEFRSV